MDYVNTEIKSTKIEGELINLTLEEKHRIYAP